MNAREAVDRAGAHAALSHEPAAEAWGIELLDATPRRLTVPRNRSRLRLPGWTVARAALGAADVEERDGVRVTTPLRTVLDLCRVLPLASACVVADSALRQALVDLEALRAALRASAGRSCSRLHRVAPLLDPASESVLETLLRVLLLQAGLRPRSQHEIRDRSGRFVARVDFCFPEYRLVVEADGFAFHANRDAYRQDRKRLNELERLGWRVLRFTWEDIVGRPEHVVSLVWECLAAAA